MSQLEMIVRLLSGIVLLLLNGIFVMTEFALTRLRQFDRGAFQQSRMLKLAWSMTEQLEIYLTACQVGITISSILLGIVFEPGITALIHPLTGLIGLNEGNTALVSITLAVVAIQLMHTVWGEQSPTYLGVEEPKRVAVIGAPVIYGWAWISYPLIYVGDYLAKLTLRTFGVTMERSWTREDEDAIGDKTELRRRMIDLLSRGDLSEERREEIVNTLELDLRETRSVMVDREAIRFLSTRRTVEDNLKLIGEERLSRFPLTTGSSIDEYVGTVYVPALLSTIDAIRAGETDWKDVAVETMTVDPTLPVSRLVDRFQEENQELALVVENGRVVGLVTATDAFEAIIGELRDPFD